MIASLSYRPIYWKANLYHLGLSLPPHTVVHLSETIRTQAVSDSLQRLLMCSVSPSSGVGPLVQTYSTKRHTLHTWISLPKYETTDDC